MGSPVVAFLQLWGLPADASKKPVTQLPATLFAFVSLCVSNKLVEAYQTWFLGVLNSQGPPGRGAPCQTFPRACPSARPFSSRWNDRSARCPSGWSTQARGKREKAEGGRAPAGSHFLYQAFSASDILASWAAEALWWGCPVQAGC